MKVLDSVVVTAARLEIAATPLAAAEANDVQWMLRGVYGGQRSGRPLWEGLTEKVSRHDQEAWSWISDFTNGRTILLLIDDIAGMTGLRIEDSSRLTELLAETQGFVFYVTDDRGTYLLSFNDHDFLIACGGARKWLEARS